MGLPPPPPPFSINGKPGIKKHSPTHTPYTAYTTHNVNIAYIVLVHIVHAIYLYISIYIYYICICIYICIYKHNTLLHTVCHVYTPPKLYILYTLYTLYWLYSCMNCTQGRHCLPRSHFCSSHVQSSLQVCCFILDQPK